MSAPSRPFNMMIYYGWLNSFNSAQNGWDNEKVAQDLARYDVLVFGDGIQSSSHGDYSNTQVIIPRIKALNPDALIFGYVTVNQNLNQFKTKAKEWNDNLEVHGIFMDEAGYDYGKKRDEFNERCELVHALSDSNICFANAWNINHVLGLENDASYPNSTYNPDSLASALNEGDFYLLESFSVNTDDTSYTNGYATASDWKTRGERAVSMREKYGVLMASAGIVNDGNANGQDLYDFSYASAVAFCLDVNGVSDALYGASSAKGKFWTRSCKALPCVESGVDVEQHGTTSRYLRYGDLGRVIVDFTEDSETSSIENY